MLPRPKNGGRQCPLLGEKRTRKRRPHSVARDPSRHLASFNYCIAKASLVGESLNFPRSLTTCSCLMGWPQSLPPQHDERGRDPFSLASLAGDRDTDR